MATQLDIYNGALVRLSKTPNIVNPATAATQNVNGQNLAAAWPIVLPAQLRRYPWNFARARAIVGAETATPLFGFNFKYAVPAEPRCLRVWDVNHNRRAWWPRGEQRFVVEGGFILSNAFAPIKLRYIAQIFDATQFDAEFVEVLTLELAAYVAPALTGSAELQQTLQREAAAKLAIAQSIDSQEGEDDDGEEGQDGDFLRYRAGFGM